MSLRGRLEDVPLTDVMQFIHLGRRTGTLRLERSDERAEINFHRGAILGAWSPRSKRLGELLLEEGLIDQEQLDRAVAEHESARPRRSFGQVLLSSTPLPVDSVRQAVKQQIEQTVFELVAWTHGAFVFELDTLKPIDDISIYPGDLIPDLDLNTQMVLLEAARIFDERNRRPEDIQAATPLPSAAATSEPQRDLGTDLEVTSPTTRRSAYDEPVLHLVSRDANFANDLGTMLGADHLQLSQLSPGDPITSLPGKAPVVVFDLRAANGTLDEMARLSRHQPHATVVGVVGDPSDTAPAYGAGAAAVVPWGAPDAVRGCLVRISRLQQPTPRAKDPGWIARSGFAKLRRVVSDLRSGVFSATVALNLMNTIAESVERAILFLVRKDDLVALGAFGFSNNHRPLAEITRTLRLPLEGDHSLAQAISVGHAISVPFDPATLPKGLADLVGPPRSGQVAIFPVMGTHKVILVIYSDNGELDRPIEEIDIIDLVAAEVGIAFENELLRQQLARGGEQS